MRARLSCANCVICLAPSRENASGDAMRTSQPLCSAKVMASLRLRSAVRTKIASMVFNGLSSIFCDGVGAAARCDCATARCANARCDCATARCDCANARVISRLDGGFNIARTLANARALQCRARLWARAKSRSQTAMMRAFSIDIKTSAISRACSLAPTIPKRIGTSFSLWQRCAYCTNKRVLV